MSDNDDNETQGVVFGVLAGVIFGIIALVAGLGMWKASQPAAPAAQVAQCIDGVLVLFDTQQKGLTGVLVDSKKQAVRCMGEETPQAPQQ